VQVDNVKSKPFEGLSYFQCKLVALSIYESKDFEGIDKKKIMQSIVVADSYPESERKRRIWQQMVNDMWGSKKCVEEGFHHYISKRQDEILEAFNYHKHNQCKSECKLCGVIECARNLEC